MNYNLFARYLFNSVDLVRLILIAIDTQNNPAIDIAIKVTVANIPAEMQSFDVFASVLPSHDDFATISKVFSRAKLINKITYKVDLRRFQ